MFYKCSKLSYIKCLATIGLNQNYTTTNWLSAVASTGTFIKDPNATWQVGSSGIPSGWITVNQCVASGINSHAEGNGTIASDDGAHAEGVFTESSGLYDMDSGHPKYGHSAAHAEGYKTTASAFAAHAEGDTTTASGYASHAEGKETEASGHNSHASGSNTIASGNNSHTEGHNTYAIGRSSHAEGIYTYAKETASHAEGYYTSANGNYSHAEGAHTYTNNESSHAEGLYTEADGQASHAEGHHTYTSSNYSHAEGSHTYANGQSSHTEGHYTETYGDGSHAEGSGSVANGYYSHAEGDHTYAEGDHSHAEGHRTISYGSNSHAEGCYTESSGMYSHTEGSYTITSNEAEHAEGKYNLSNTGTLNSIGIGTSSTDRKNAFEVMDNGDTFIYGVGNYDGTNINATNAKGERLPASIQEVMPIYDKEKRSVCFQHNETDNSLNEAQSDYSFVIGYNNKAIREETDEGGLTLQSANTFIGGMDNRAYHSNCIVFGEGLFTQFGNTFVLGKYNGIVSNQDGWGDTVLGIVGDGYKDSAGNATGRNVLLLQGGGDPALHCRGGFKNNASWINDFGEYFEWLDGNPENEDRIGYMVQLNGDKIELATSLEKCIGVISGTTGFIGGVCAFEWHNKFLHDKWGREIIGEDGNPIINPDYNPDLEYIPRELRKEWDVVGLIGQVVTRQDGTLKVGGYAGCSNGIATNATSGFKVLKIIDNETAIILVK